MEIRVLGTRDECLEFSRMVRKNVDKDFIRSISKWYPNVRSGEYSTEGRIYIKFRDTFSQDCLLEAPPEPETPAGPGKPERGECGYCHKKDTDLMILSWDNGRYYGACSECARKYVNEQTVGMLLKRENPELYEELDKMAHPKFRGVYMGPTGTMDIWY